MRNLILVLIAVIFFGANSLAQGNLDKNLWCTAITSPELPMPVTSDDQASLNDPYEAQEQCFARALETNKQAQKTIKVMTYNIWNGFDWGKDTERKANLIEWVKKQKPDVLALQELCGYTEDQLKEDAMQWGHQYVQLLKTKGYPTALTSNQPIRLKEKSIKPFWHGLLHCETYGIDFYIVHLSPADSDFRLKEAKLITEKIDNSNSDSYIILGDFNSHSPFDANWLENKDELRAKLLGKKKSKYSNLRNGEFDYSVISEFLACPAIDVCLNRTETKDAFTFPTKALIGKYSATKKSVERDRERIDYILASPKLAKMCNKVQIYNQEATRFLSDHYPMTAVFYLGQ
ncbi:MULTISPECIES: endonuclease/exonuclease/phosphatase family protein [unclassified Carboxylicivirga]|uniref:endonuclease/exonuclease/phosphatase family protein n=1 Tax=Carboxylicivirga TaxID=1628153 RepID=UPI003D347B5A